MKELKVTESADEASDFELGMMLGSRKAFAAVAGRCSAADAECLRRIREEKLYLRRAASWDEFCPSHLGLSRAHANRIIGYLEEFGPDYFEVTQLTRITPEQYRAIAPAIREKNIHVDGQAIALIPENTERVAAAVAALRQSAVPTATPRRPVEERFELLKNRFDQFAAEYQKLAECSLSKEDKCELLEILSRAVLRLRRLQAEAR